MAYDDSTVVIVFISTMHNIQCQPNINTLFLSSPIDATSIDEDALIGHGPELVCPKAVPKSVLVRWQIGVRYTSVKSDFGEYPPGNSSSESLSNFLDIVAGICVTTQAGGISPSGSSQVVKVLPVNEDNCAHCSSQKTPARGHDHWPYPAGGVKVCRFYMPVAAYVNRTLVRFVILQIHLQYNDCVLRSQDWTSIKD